MKEKEAIEYLKTKYLHQDSPANPSKELCIMHNEALDLAIAALKEEDKRKKKSVTLEQIKEIVDYLNQVCGTSYKYNNKQTQSYINARFSEGYTMEDFKNVIDKKAKEWKGTQFEQFLKPGTLFCTKFEGYVNQKEKVFRPKGQQDILGEWRDS